MILCGRFVVVPAEAGDSGRRDPVGPLRPPLSRGRRIIIAGRALKVPNG